MAPQQFGLRRACSEFDALCRASPSCGSSVCCVIVSAQQEDQFFATVFFGSGLLFLAMLFTAAAIVGAILVGFALQPEQLIGSATFHFARAAAYSLVNVYMIKMASVFMITTSTVAIYTGIAPRWLALLGYALSLLLLFGSYYFSWSFLVFPLWVFLLSVYILRDSMRRPSGHPAKGSA